MRQQYAEKSPANKLISPNRAPLSHSPLFQTEGKSGAEVGGLIELGNALVFEAELRLSLLTQPSLKTASIPHKSLPPIIIPKAPDSLLAFSKFPLETRRKSIVTQRAILYSLQMADNNIKPQSGLVAFFDILGYQNFLEANNASEEVTNKVLSTIITLKNKVPESFIKSLHRLKPPDETIELIKNTMDEIGWLVFSDTILLTLPIAKEMDAGSKSLRAVILLTMCSMMHRYLFDFGLPLRGALTNGDFITHETCFAGEPIIEAYKLASQVDCSGFVLSKNAASYLNNIDKVILDRNFIFNYNVPFKSGEYNPMMIVAPSVVHSVENQSDWSKNDVRQIVLEAFWRHNKSIDGSVLQKITNTELLLRHYKMKIGELFK